MRRLLITLFGLAALAIIAPGCDDENSCEATTENLCQTACDCGDCAIGSDGGSLSFDAVSDCIALFSLGCSGGGFVDAEACNTALETTQCIDLSGDKMGIASLPECQYNE